MVFGNVPPFKFSVGYKFFGDTVIIKITHTLIICGALANYASLTVNLNVSSLLNAEILVQ